MGGLDLPPVAPRDLVARPVRDWTEWRFGGFSAAGLAGQCEAGLLLGVVRSPCVELALGAASASWS